MFTNQNKTPGMHD